LSERSRPKGCWPWLAYPRAREKAKRLTGADRPQGWTVVPVRLVPMAQAFEAVPERSLPGGPLHRPGSRIDWSEADWSVIAHRHSR
jgi:hypothetical protein